MHKTINHLVEILRKQKKTLALAESMTCGLAAHQFTLVHGASDAFLGCIVCYNADLKVKLLKIDKKLIDKYTPESQQVTDELVLKLAKIIKADVYGAITGLATTGGSEDEEKPVGTVFISVLIKGQIYHEEKKFKGKPMDIKKKACEALYRLLIQKLSK